MLRRQPSSRVIVFEKERDVGRHQSGRNSGVLHAGRYHALGSAKAPLAVVGIRAVRAFCEQHSIPHEMCGKLVVAADESERPRLLGSSAGVRKTVCRVCV